MGRGPGKFWRDERAVVAPLFAMGLFALLGMGALAWDLSRGFALRAELEAAVDAAALAGATQLDGKDGAQARALTAVYGGLVQNSERLADTSDSNVTEASDVTVVFWSALPGTPGANDSPTDAQTAFIEVTANPRRLGLVLGALSGVTDFDARARAVAGFGSGVCNIPPLMVCNPGEAGGNLLFDGNDHTGRSILLTPPPGGNTQWGPGNYGFLAPDGVSGADAVREGMGRISPQYACFGNQIETQPGNIAVADDWYNIRFDIYRASAAGRKTDDFYPPALNTIVGKTTNGGASACNPSLTAPTNSCASSSALPAMGLPVDCGQTSASPWGTAVWNAAQYFATNHSSINPSTYTPQTNPDPHPSRATASGWASYGPDGIGTSPTRYQVYEWEKAILSGAIAKPSGAFSNSQDATGGNKDFARPQCFSGTAQQTVPDRRTISAVVVNCIADDVRGRDTVTVIGHVDLFLTHPAVSDEIYGEVIEATTSTSTVGQETRVFSVRLYE